MGESTYYIDLKDCDSIESLFSEIEKYLKNSQFDSLPWIIGIIIVYIIIIIIIIIILFV